MSVAKPLIHVDLVLLHQASTPLACLETILFLRSITSGQVEPRIIAVDALLVGVQEVLPDFGGMEQRLGGNATDVQAGAAEFGILLDDCCFQSVLTGADRRGVAAGAAADNRTS